MRRSALGGVPIRRPAIDGSHVWELATSPGFALRRLSAPDKKKAPKFPSGLSRVTVTNVSDGPSGEITATRSVHPSRYGSH